MQRESIHHLINNFLDIILNKINNGNNNKVNIQNLNRINNFDLTEDTSRLRKWISYRFLTNQFFNKIPIYFLL